MGYSALGPISGTFQMPVSYQMHNVRLNCICPQATDTAIQQKNLLGLQEELIPFFEESQKQFTKYAELIKYVEHLNFITLTSI